MMLTGGFRAACMLCMSPGSTNASPALEGYLPIRSRHRQKVQVRQYKEVTEGLRSDSITQSPALLPRLNTPSICLRRSSISPVRHQ